MGYLVGAWLITQVLDIIIPAFQLPTGLLRVTIIVVILGFPCWIIFSWVYEITPEGIRKTAAVDPETSITPQTSNRLNYIIIGALGIAIALLVYEIVSQRQSVSEIISDSVSKSPINDEIATTAADTIDKTIAVLAFTDMSPRRIRSILVMGLVKRS